MAQPTRDDAALALQIAQLSALLGVPAATNWVLGDEFIPEYEAFVQKWPRGSEGYGKVRLVANHYETIGTLWKHGLINEDLLFDWLWAAGVWDRLKGWVIGQRKAAGNPALGENFEAMARANRRWAARRRRPAGRSGPRRRPGATGSRPEGRRPAGAGRSRGTRESAGGTRRRRRGRSRR